MSVYPGEPIIVDRIVRRYAAKTGRLLNGGVHTIYYVKHAVAE